MKVLIIEDEHLAADKLSRMLHELDPNIQILALLESVSESAAWLSSNPAPDLIFMDMYMGTEASLLLGCDAVAELRNRGTESIICGMSANDVETLFDDAGADAFVFKPLPFRPEALKRELNRILMAGDGLELW